MTLRERVLYAIQSEGYGQDPSDMYDRIYAAVEACFEPPAARSVPQADGYSGTLPTCDFPMIPVAGGGFLYCNEPRGHAGDHAYTSSLMYFV